MNQSVAGTTYERQAGSPRCRELTEDMSFASVRAHKERPAQGARRCRSTAPGAPHRGLRVAVHGGGKQIEITAADSRFGSFICSIVKSTMELGHLDVLDGMVFHDICDSARNLACSSAQFQGQTVHGVFPSAPSLTTPRRLFSWPASTKGSTPSWPPCAGAGRTWTTSGSP